ncbi:nitrogenase iron-molybdenum cofactor biosynthesis protein NifN [Paenibacillus camerounensis]|uniref:nitrogenase iron-molybdenum cofactor biosynthesis protein NifN n=1 Tax=Paenibacillus camerounensis TaxID=1243663 RepID=UPI0005A8AF6F|nr:nitrogenase iron-molybdenum cofactor biosynthesis protein NifN [Paenibacillus camerounensis]
MARVNNEIPPAKPWPINPLRVSQAVGGVLALQGIYRSVPVLHGAEGCTESVKQSLARHFREPISVQNIAIHEQNLIFGGSQSIHDMLQHVTSEYQPDVIALIGTSLTEVVGEDLLGAVEAYYKLHKERFHDRLLLGLYLPDYEGSLESGYAQTVYCVLQKLLRSSGRRSRSRKRTSRINLLPGSHLTPGDVMELKEMIASFGIEVIVLPDLSSSLTGHLMTGYTPLTRGGVPLDYLRELPSSAYTIVIGRSMEPCARLLEEELGIPYRLFHGVTGLCESDELILLLRRLSGNEGPNKYRWQRQFLLDCMLDTRSAFRGRHVVAALEGDHLVSVFQTFKEMGIRRFSGVVPVQSPALELLPPGISVGDLDDLERLAMDEGDLWISNSYGAERAEQQHTPYLPAGFPVFNRFGSPATTSVGYRGTAELLCLYANTLISKERMYL